MKKSAIRQFCQKILDSHIPGSVILDDNDFLLDLFATHPHWEFKKGAGVLFISVEKALFNTKCFWINRIDGTKIHISYNQCLIGKINKTANVKKACRNAVSSEISKIRSVVNFGADTCPFTSEVLTPENTHIDHYDLKFAELFNLWIADKSIDELYLLTNYEPQNHNVDIFFTDKSIASDFLLFHNANTNLRAVSKRANLTLLR